MMEPSLFREHRLIFFSPSTSPETPSQRDESEDESVKQRESVNKTVDKAELKSLYDKVQSLLTRAEERSRYLPEEGPKGSRAWEKYINAEVDVVNAALEKNWVDAIKSLTRLHSNLLMLSVWQDRQMENMKPYELYETGRRVEYRRGPLGRLRRRCVPYAHLVTVDPLAGRKGFDANDLDPFPETPLSEVRSDEPVPVTPVVESQPAVQQDAEADRVLEDAEGLLHGIKIDDEESVSRVESTISTINRVGSALWHLDRNDPRIPRLLAARDALNAALKEYRDSLLPPAKETAVPEEVDEEKPEETEEAVMEEEETVETEVEEEKEEEVADKEAAERERSTAESGVDPVRSAVAERIRDPKERVKGRNAVSVDVKNGRYILSIDLKSLGDLIPKNAQSAIQTLLPLQDNVSGRHMNRDRDSLRGVKDQRDFDAIVRQLVAAIRVDDEKERAKYLSLSQDDMWHDASEIKGGQEGWRYRVVPDGSMVAWNVGRGEIKHFSEQSQKWDEITGSPFTKWLRSSLTEEWKDGKDVIGGKEGWSYRIDPNSGQIVAWRGADVSVLENNGSWRLLKEKGPDLEALKYQSIPSDGNYYPADRIVGGTPGWRYRREGRAMYAMKDNTIQRYSFGEQGGQEWRIVR